MNTHQPAEVGSKDSQNMDIFHIWDILELFCLLLHPSCEEENK